MSVNTDKSNCQVEQIAAYLDGELDDRAHALFERHLRECSVCGAELIQQRSLLCALDSVLSRGSDLPLPANFAQVVAAHAESDMRGVRDRREHGRALRVCLVLAAASLALSGVAAREFVFNFARTIARPISAVFDLVWTTLYDAVTGLGIISRVLSKGFVPDSHLVGMVALLFLVLAVLLLSRLIASYHRTSLVE